MTLNHKEISTTSTFLLLREGLKENIHFNKLATPPSIVYAIEGFY